MVCLVRVPLIRLFICPNRSSCNYVIRCFIVCVRVCVCVCHKCWAKYITVSDGFQYDGMLRQSVSHVFVLFAQTDRSVVISLYVLLCVCVYVYVSQNLGKVDYCFIVIA